MFSRGEVIAPTSQINERVERDGERKESKREKLRKSHELCERRHEQVEGVSHLWLDIVSTRVCVCLFVSFITMLIPLELLLEIVSLSPVCTKTHSLLVSSPEFKLRDK